jgi:hypothetical protein
MELHDDFEPRRGSGVSAMDASRLQVQTASSIHPSSGFSLRASFSLCAPGLSIAILFVFSSALFSTTPTLTYFQLDSVTSIIFCTALSEYNQVLKEQRRWYVFFLVEFFFRGFDSFLSFLLFISTFFGGGRICNGFDSSISLWEGERRKEDPRTRAEGSVRLVGMCGGVHRYTMKISQRRAV